MPHLINFRKINMIYNALKQAMVEAGFAASEGDEFTTADMQASRDFFYITGRKMEEFVDFMGNPVAQPEMTLTEEEQAAQDAAVAAAEADRLAQEEAERLRLEAEETERQAKEEADAISQKAVDDAAEADRLAQAEAEAAAKAAEEATEEAPQDETTEEAGE